MRRAKSSSKTSSQWRKSTRRSFLRRAAVGAATAGAAGGPLIWLPNRAYAQTAARGTVKHLIYIRLSGGFRFTTAFNGDVAAEFNPFGLASGRPSGAEWGVSSLLGGADWLEGDDGLARADLGMRNVVDISNDIAVMTTVDHEPLSGNADGNHGTGLERYYTGYVGGENSFFTMINYGVRERIATAAANEVIVLPPFVLGAAGMALGSGPYAAYRPPLIQGDSLDGFTFRATEALPAWAQDMPQVLDENMRLKQMVPGRPPIEAYQGSRESTQKFAEIFASDELRILNNSDEAVDGISNNELATMLGDSGAARRIRLALRLFRFGAPAVFLNEGGYDMHSNEETQLPGAMNDLNRLISGTHAALQRLSHPEGGSYWDHTLVVLGSEFGRTARGNRFNSAGGSDHGGDRATRWMSMPMMGGMISSAGLGGRSIGSTNRTTLEADGEVYSYRSVLKTLMDLLGADHDEFFPADAPIEGLF